MSDMTSCLKTGENNPGECKKLDDAEKSGRDRVAKATLLSELDVMGSQIQVGMASA